DDRRGDERRPVSLRLLRRQHREDPPVPPRVWLHEEHALQEPPQPKASRHRRRPLASALRCVGRDLQGARPRWRLRGRLPAGSRLRQHPRPPLQALSAGVGDGNFRGYIASKRRYFYGL
ncbi:MAG: hypothetical protein AVDCRST_MAG37-2392, partial [uncultured Rubrobacteraceae bacterium]